MKNQFIKSITASLSEAEQALQVWGIKYEKKPDGSLFVPGDLDISGRNLIRLPDLTKVTVAGSFCCSDNHLASLEHAPVTVGRNFYCNHNRLTSLEHAPVTVGGDFSCSSNQLTSLEHAPATVGGAFSCSENHLKSLEHAPATVGGDFYCYSNQLTSLEHAPATVSGGFYCGNNRLTSLEHAPATAGDGFYCFNNQLTSLEGAPQKFKKLASDFGEFFSWDQVPEQLRISPKTRAWLEEETVRLEEEREKAFSEGSTVLQSAIKVSSPIRLKR